MENELIAASQIQQVIVEDDMAQLLALHSEEDNAIYLSIGHRDCTNKLFTICDYLSKVSFPDV